MQRNLDLLTDNPLTYMNAKYYPSSRIHSQPSFQMFYLELR